MKNNIGYINNTSFSCDPIKTPSDGTLLERTSSEIFVMLVVHSVLHLHCAVVLSLFPGNFAMLPVLHAVFSGPWRPPPALSSALATFDCLCFFIYRGRYGFERAFFTHRRFFTLRSFPHIFDSTCVYQGLPGSPQFFLDVFRASCWSSKHRPGSFVCLIYSNPQLHIQKNLFLNSTKYYHELLVVKV